jgi:hypothetical protein
MMVHFLMNHHKLLMTSLHPVIFLTFWQMVQQNMAFASAQTGRADSAASTHVEAASGQGVSAFLFDYFDVCDRFFLGVSVG